MNLTNELDLPAPLVKRPKVKTFQFMQTHFMEFVQKNGSCWDWLGNIEQRWGYGRIKICGKQIKAHRLSWMIHRGEIPSNLGVLHKCDRPNCVNPEHLFLGTDMDNQRDCITKGRKKTKCGEYSHFAKLKTEDVRRIRILAVKQSQREVANLFGVCRSTIGAIVRHENWAQT